jgi:hypothetical protein
MCGLLQKIGIRENIKPFYELVFKIQIMRNCLIKLRQCLKNWLIYVQILFIKIYFELEASLHKSKLKWIKDNRGTEKKVGQSFGFYDHKFMLNSDSYA